MELTVKQVAERLHVSGEKVRQMVNEGRFPHAYKLDALKETSPFLIPAKDVAAFERSRHDLPFRSSRAVR